MHKSTQQKVYNSTGGKNSQNIQCGNDTKFFNQGAITKKYCEGSCQTS